MTARKRGPPDSHLRLSTIVICILIWLPVASRAQSTTLAPGADQPALAAVTAAASRVKLAGRTLSQPTLNKTQSFRLLRNGQEIGNLVSGKGTLSSLAPDANPVEACFVSLVRPGTDPALVLTIGAGDWETEECTGIIAVGMLPDSGGGSRAAVVYKASAPHESPKEPVVLGWSASQPLSIDEAGSKRASLAGATTLPAIRAALR